MTNSTTEKPWKPRPPVAARLQQAPAEAVGPEERVVPIRKPEGFQPAVQRWSYQVPEGEAVFHLAYFGAEAADEAGLLAHPLHQWVRESLAGHEHGPSTLSQSRSRNSNGFLTLAFSAYWVSTAAFKAWSEDMQVESFWRDPARLAGPLGTWREIFEIPRNRQESLYWLDFPKGMSASPNVALYPTPYCGYYGSMRDRLGAAATDLLAQAADADLTRHPERRGFGEHWKVTTPHNMTIICGGSSWGFMGPAQHADYDERLRQPVTDGMMYLDKNPLPSGCLSMRWQQSVDESGSWEPDEHAHAYFISLKHLENWSENHASHAAIFGAAIARYKKYGGANELRTWHEVFVVPQGAHTIEYLNCAPDTGLLPYFNAVQLK